MCKQFRETAANEQICSIILHSIIKKILLTFMLIEVVSLMLDRILWNIPTNTGTLFSTRPQYLTPISLLSIHHATTHLSLNSSSVNTILFCYVSLLSQIKSMNTQYTTPFHLRCISSLPLYTDFWLNKINHKWLNEKWTKLKISKWHRKSIGSCYYINS